MYLLVFITYFLIVYQTIVLDEDNFLCSKFDDQYHRYNNSLNRWIPNLQSISATFKTMHFKWKRWILKEYNTQYVWLSGITLILLLKYDQLTHNDEHLRNVLLIVILSTLLFLYLLVSYLKKSGKMTE